MKVVRSVTNVRLVSEHGCRYSRIVGTTRDALPGPCREHSPSGMRNHQQEFTSRIEADSNYPADEQIESHHLPVRLATPRFFEGY